MVTKKFDRLADLRYPNLMIFDQLSPQRVDEFKPKKELHFVFFVRKDRSLRLNLTLRIVVCLKNLSTVLKHVS